MPHRRGRAGFTLLEVLVALSIAGLLLLGARWMLASAADGAEFTAAAAAHTDRSANARQLARDLALRTEVRPDAGGGFVGHPLGARWGTWCDAPEGWLERCQVTLAVVSTADRRSVALGLPDGAVVPVWRDVGRASLLYLRSPVEGGVWVDRWASETRGPLAIGVVLDEDTLILRIGERG